MQISVNGKNIELNFGIRFVRELDKKFHLTLEGGKRIGTGLEETVPLLFTGDILAAGRHYTSSGVGRWMALLHRKRWTIIWIALRI